MKINLKLLISSAFMALVCTVLQHTYGGESEDDKRPHEHICPITHEVMKDPVVAADGHSYERDAILRYFEEEPQPKSPITGLPLRDKNIVDNQALKTMILDWRAGSQGGPSALETHNAANIAEQVREEFNRNAVLLKSAMGQHIVAFLGNTGAGKSTLVNFLAGKKIKVGPCGENYVLVNPDDEEAMVIGTGGESQTLFPKFIDVERDVGKMRFFDLPGFNDTDGSVRNLVNAAFIRKILLDAASVRLVFVVGQDQFTADRSASVRQMFNCLKHLFVVTEDANLVDDGIFVATKVTYDPLAKINFTDFLLTRTDSKDKADLNEQLQSWSERGKISRMFHPLRNSTNDGVRDEILNHIQRAGSAKIHGINVSALYPPDTKQDLERMFLTVIEDALTRKFTEHLVTISDYDKAIGYYTSMDFWQQFERDVCTKEAAVDLLKEFCSTPFSKAMRTLEQNSKEKLEAHIQGLEERRTKRIEDIEKRTSQKTKEVISSLVPSKVENNNHVAFDFAYHRDFHDQVCGKEVICQLASDPLEQEIVRSYYAELISKHSHDQMMRWYEKFSQVGELTQRLAKLEQEVAPITGEREAARIAAEQEAARKAAEAAPIAAEQPK